MTNRLTFRVEQPCQQTPANALFSQINGYDSYCKPIVYSSYGGAEGCENE